jgi:hypothetical protein
VLDGWGWGDIILKWAEYSESIDQHNPLGFKILDIHAYKRSLSSLTLPPLSLSLSPGTTNTEADLSKSLKDAVPPSKNWGQDSNLQRSHLLFKSHLKIILIKGK